jgi:hypothetical protein
MTPVEQIANATFLGALIIQVFSGTIQFYGAQLRMALLMILQLSSPLWHPSYLLTIAFTKQRPKFPKGYLQTKKSITGTMVIMVIMGTTFVLLRIFHQ